MKSLLRQGSLYILLAALLAGTLWRGSYFPTPDEQFAGAADLFSPRWIFVSLLMLAGAWELAAQAYERRGGILTSALLWIFAVFAVFSVASYSWSSVPDVTTRDAFLLVAYFAALLVAVAQLLRSPGKTASAFSWWLVYSAAFVAAWGIITYIVRLAPYANQVDGLYRAGGTLEYSNALGCFSLMAIPLAAALMRQPKKEDRLLLALALSILTAAVLLSLSRSAALLLVPVYVYTLLAFRKDGALMLRLSSLFSGSVLAVAAIYLSESGRQTAGVLAVVAIMIISHFWQRYIDGLDARRAAASTFSAGGVLLAVALFIASFSGRTRSIFSERFGEGLTFSRLLPHRIDTYSGAMDALRERPVKGWGLGSFASVYQDYAITSYTKYAHNLVLQAAVDTGIIGAFLMSLFLLYVAGMSILRLVTRTTGLAGAAGVSALVFIIFNMFDWEWYVPALTAWFMVLAALVAAGGGIEPEPANG